MRTKLEIINGKGLVVLLASLYLCLPVALARADGALFWTSYTASSIRMDTVPSTGQMAIASNQNLPLAVAYDPVNYKVYWYANASIKRSNVDGSVVETVIPALSDKVYGIRVDPVAGKIYYSDFTSGKLFKANINGSAITEVITGLIKPLGIAIDPANSKIYVAGYSGALYRVGMDGSNLQQIIINGGTNSFSTVDLDLVNARIYFASYSGGTVYSANLDGSSITTIQTSVGSWYGIIADVAGGKIYGADYTGNRIAQMNLDGSGLTTIESTSGPLNIAFTSNYVPTPPTATPTATFTASPTNTVTQTPTASATATPVATNTATYTPTATHTPDPVVTIEPATPTPLPTTTPVATSTPTATNTFTPTVTGTSTPVATQTPNSLPTQLPTVAATETATITPSPSATPTPSSTPTAVQTPTPFVSTIITVLPTATKTPVATVTSVSAQSITTTIKVLDTDGKPVAGALVVVDGVGSFITDSNGLVTITNMPVAPDGSIAKILVTKDGHVFPVTQLVITIGNTVTSVVDSQLPPVCTATDLTSKQKKLSNKFTKLYLNALSAAQTGANHAASKNLSKFVTRFEGHMKVMRSTFSKGQKSELKLPTRSLVCKQVVSGCKKTTFTKALANMDAIAAKLLLYTSHSTQAMTEEHLGTKQLEKNYLGAGASLFTQVRSALHALPKTTIVCK